MEEIKSSFSGVNKIIEEYKKPTYIVSFIEINEYNNTQEWNVDLFFEEKDCYRYIMDLLEKAVTYTYDHFDFDTGWFNSYGPSFEEYFNCREDYYLVIKYIGKSINLEIIDHIILCLNSSQDIIKRQYYYNIVKK